MDDAPAHYNTTKAAQTTSILVDSAQMYSFCPMMLIYLHLWLLTCFNERTGELSGLEAPIFLLSFPRYCWIFKRSASLLSSRVLKLFFDCAANNQGILKQAVDLCCFSRCSRISRYIPCDSHWRRSSHLAGLDVDSGSLFQCQLGSFCLGRGGVSHLNSRSAFSSITSALPAAAWIEIEQL